jgi:hypothetical protein
MVDGRGYAITRIELRGGLLLITAYGMTIIHSPARPDVPATVYGQDGQGICQGWKTPMPELFPGQHVTIILPIRIASLEDE